MKKQIKVILCCVFLIVALCFAGRSDWSEQVIYVMPQSAYESITAKLGENCSDYEIAREYVKNKSYYDAMGY
jgi:hypothetical protein